MRGQRLPHQLARGHVGELEPRMRGQQADQFSADVTAGTDDADAQGVHAGSFRVAAWLAQYAMQSAISSIADSPYQNTFHLSCLMQPSDSA